MGSVLPKRTRVPSPRVTRHLSMSQPRLKLIGGMERGGEGEHKVTLDAEEMAGGERSGPERRWRPRAIERERAGVFRVEEEEVKEKLLG